MFFGFVLMLPTHWRVPPGEYDEPKKFSERTESAAVAILIGEGLVLAGALLSRRALLADALRRVREEAAAAAKEVAEERPTYPIFLTVSVNLNRASVDLHLAAMAGQIRRLALMETLEWTRQQPASTPIDLSSAIAQNSARLLATRFTEDDVESAIAAMSLLIRERYWSRETQLSADRAIGGLRYRQISGAKRFLAAAAFEFERPRELPDDWEGAHPKDFLDGTPHEVAILRKALETCRLGGNELLRSFSLHCMTLLDQE